jgi:beta-lactamase class D
MVRNSLFILDHKHKQKQTPRFFVGFLSIFAEICSMRKTFFSLLVVSVLFCACSPNNVTIDNGLKKYFDSASVNGSFGLFDNTQGHFTIYNLPRYRDSAYVPGGTFNILSSLVGIQTGVVKDDSAILHWDPSLIIRSDCPNDRSLRSFFQYPCTFAFEELCRRIGKDTLKKWIDSLGYGNKDTGGGADSFWINGHLKITADEQLGLVKKLYFEQLPFFQRTQRIVRGMMQMANNSNYQLSYKTGHGNSMQEERGKAHAVGWVMGWIEENKHPYFFVVNLESANSNMDMEKIGVDILRSILRQMGFFEGKK